MKATTLISRHEYLATAYRPDCDYLEGVVVERNVGEIPHSDLQAELTAYVRNRRKQWKVDAYPELRVQVRPDRFRVPDICIFGGPWPLEGYLTAPPLACIEILSKDDRMADIEERVEDYLAFGVPHVWILNPYNRKAYVYTSEGRKEIKDGVLRTENPRIEISIAELFRDAG
ncbi:MAG: Uma2 family endonuclease [Acidobacteria bacterium]|nr:Uma2 family endonuclease [Acidobacteriota bacterium]